MFLCINFLIYSALAFQERKLTKLQDQDSFPGMWFPPTSFSMNKNMTTSGSNLAITDLRSKAADWAANNLQLASSDEQVVISRNFNDDVSGLHHCYMVKMSNGLEIANSVAQLTLMQNGDWVSNSHSWANTDASKSPLVKRGAGISCADALMSVAKSLKENVDPSTIKATTNGSTTWMDGLSFTTGAVGCQEKLYQTPSELRHVYSLTVPTPSQFLNLMVDKENGQVLGANDWTSHLSFTPNGRLVRRHNLEKRATQKAPTFRVVQLGALDPRTAPTSLVSDPVDFASSPNGWNDGNSQTIGNNVIATENSANEQDIRKIANNGKQAKAQNFNFDFAADDSKQDPAQYVNAAITNAFFLSNRYHDIMNQYGFDEQSGNFQQTNQNGGKDGDPVLALVQDGSGKNNANFASPPDGTPGVMRMFVFDSSKPQRDGALENAVVLHELTHGLSNRLTGGADNANCLSTPESGGLGEGWSDIVAIALEMEDIDTPTTPKVVGQYVTNDPKKGVRQFAFSTDMNVNPHKFSDGQKTKEVHAVGEIWTSMLFEVYWNMVNKSGFDKSFRTNPQGAAGNNQFLKTLVAAMKTQPCNPTFTDARDAMLAADKAMTGGKYQCEISNGFAKRGLGINAQSDGKFVDDFTVPPNCK